MRYAPSLPLLETNKAFSISPKIWETPASMSFPSPLPSNDQLSTTEMSNMPLAGFAIMATANLGRALVPEARVANAFSS